MFRDSVQIRFAWILFKNCVMKVSTLKFFFQLPLSIGYNVFVYCYKAWQMKAVGITWLHLETREQAASDRGWQRRRGNEKAMGGEGEQVGRAGARDIGGYSYSYEYIIEKTG